MRGFGERKFWIVHAILVIILIIGFVFASGCEDISKLIGGTKTGAQTTLTPTGTPAKDITQTTQALGTPTPGGGGTGGSGSGAGGTCCNRIMITPIMKMPEGLRDLWTGSFGAAFYSGFYNSRAFTHGCPDIEFYMAQWELPEELQRYHEYFGTASDSDAEYLWVGTVSVDNIQGKPNWSTSSWGHWCWKDNDCDDTPYGDYTFTMKLVDPWHGHTVLKEGSVSWKGGIMDGFSHKVDFYQPSTDSMNVKIVDLIGDFAKQQFMPLDKIVRDYERIPEKCTVKPEKDPVQTGEKMKITLSEFADSEGRLPQSWDRVLVKAEKGKILNGYDKGDGFRAFFVGGGTVDVEYQAPCDGTTETITVYNSCNTYEYPGDPPLSNTHKQKIIVTKTFEVEDKKPVIGQISPAKDNLNPSETIDVTVDNLKDKKGQPPDPAQRILVKADHGQILGGTAAGTHQAFNVGSSPIKFQYKAPDSCDITSSDTITVYNSCDADEDVPLSRTRFKNQIATKNIDLKCKGDGYIEYDKTFSSISEVKGTIPFTINTNTNPPRIEGAGIYQASYHAGDCNGEGNVKVKIDGLVVKNPYGPTSPVTLVDYNLTEDWSDVKPVLCKTDKNIVYTNFPWYTLCNYKGDPNKNLPIGVNCGVITQNYRHDLESYTLGDFNNRAMSLKHIFYYKPCPYVGSCPGGKY